MTDNYFGIFGFKSGTVKTPTLLKALNRFQGIGDWGSGGENNGLTFMGMDKMWIASVTMFCHPDGDINSKFSIDEISLS